MKLRVKLQERDIDILNDIKFNRVLTVSQIKELHFKKQKSYHLKRIDKLAKAGYIIKRPFVSRKYGKKESTCCYLSKAGYELLGEEEVNPRKDIEPYKHHYRLSLAELYVHLSKLGWTFLNSKMVKQEYSLPNNDRINLILRRKNTSEAKGYDEYGLYLIDEPPGDITINKIQDEIKRNYHTAQSKPISNVIILHRYGTEENPDIISCVTEVTEKETIKENGEIKTITTRRKTTVNWEENFGLYGLLTLDYNKGLELLRYMVDPDYIVNAPPFKKALEKNHITFSHREIGSVSKHVGLFDGKKEIWIVELVSNNLTQVKKLKQYTGQEAGSKGRQVAILTDRPEYWRTVFNDRTLFAVIPVDLGNTIQLTNAYLGEQP